MLTFCRPGELLFEWLLCHDLAQRFEDHGITSEMLYKLVTGDVPTNAEVDALLKEVLGTSEGFWLAIQKRYDSGLPG